jgi:hypothetical protein
MKKKIIAGFAPGTVIALLIMVLSYLHPDFSSKPLGFHTGLWGLLVNIIKVIAYNRKLTIYNNNR